MKTIIFYLAVSLAFTLLSVTSHSKPIDVKLKSGQVLIYEWNRKEILQISDSKNVPDWMQTNRFSITITNRSENKLIFTAQMLKKTEQHIQAGEIYTRNYAFPELKNYFWEIWEPETSEEILYSLPFNYEMNLNT